MKKRNKRLVFDLKRVGTALLAICLVTATGMSLLPRPKVMAQSTPTVPICGERQASDVEEYTGSSLPNPAYTNEITPGGSGAIAYYRYWPGGSGQDARWYILSSTSKTAATFYVYDATSDSLINTFTISIPADLQGQTTQSTFAVDPSGNVYIGTYATSSAGGSVSQWLWSPGQTSATAGWSATTTKLLNGALYGYTDTNGVYRVAAVVSEGSSPFSDTFNASTGASMGTNSLYGTDIQAADAHGGDLVSVDQNTNGIYIWDSTATTQRFYMSAGQPAGWSGQPAGANELADGTIVMTSYASRSMFFFNSSGGYLGSIGADRGAGDPLDDIDNVSSITVENSRIYYMAENPFSSPNKLTYVTVANAQAYLASPQGAPFHLGLGANISTPEQYNYFPSGTSPSASLTFTPWWQSVAGNFTGQYTVRSISQVLANQAGTPQSFSVPSTASDYSSGQATVPLTLPAANPGFYEVSAQLLQGGQVVGADCAVYSIGASGDTFNPAALTGGTDTQGVALAYQFGQRLYRSSYNLDQCFPGVTDPTSATALDCPSDMDSDISAAAALAATDGVTYEIQLGTGTTFDTNAVSSGQWQRLIGLMVAHYSEVADWECWNEPDNNSFSSATDYVTNALEPCYNAVKGVSSNDKVIGISNDGHSAGQYAAYVNAGALNYLDIVAIHAYTGWNKSFEEQGAIIPTAYDSAETGEIDALQTYLQSKGYTGPIYDTESGFWNNSASAPYDYYMQGDKLVTKMILEQSIGMDWYSNFFNSGGYQVDGAYWELLGGANGALSPGGLAAVNYQANLGGRSFQGWLPTNTPHTYAALYGPSGSDPNDVVAIWADGYNVNVLPTLSGSGTIGVTSEYGNASTLASGGSLTLANQVQYLSVPSGQNLTISPAESFGTNVALASQGASATASSSWACSGGGTADPNVVLSGIIDAEGSNNVCGGRDGTIWSAAYGDSDPTLTITLGSPQTLDRVFISSYSLGSVLTNLRSYQLQVSSNGTDFTTVATVTNNFYNRDNLISFNAQTVAAIRITGIQINYTGYGDGLKPTFWDSSFDNSSDLTSIYDVEAYAPGAGAPTPPTVSISSPANNASAYGSSQAVTAAVTPNGGSTIASAQLLIDGTSTQTLTAAPYDFTLDPLDLTDGSHNLQIEATDSQGNSSSQYLTIYITNGDLTDARKVTISDLAIMATNWGKQSGAIYNEGDINEDGKINIQDLGILARNWGASW